MQTVTINFTVSGQTLTVTNPPIKIASNTVKYVKAVFALDSDWTGFDVASAIWYNDFAQIAVVLDENGECMIPHEVLAKPDDVMVNLVGRDIVNNELVDRLTTYPAKALDVDANAKITGTETAPVTPSQFEQYIAIVEQLVGSVKDIDRTELNSDYTLTIYYTDGTSDTVGPIRGATGATGNGVLSAVLNPDYTLTLNYTNGQHDTVGPIRGVQGETGNGIQSIYLTGTSGAVKTYTILFTDGNTTEFQVTDGEVTNAVLEQVLPTDTASGAIASFPDGTDLFGAKSLVVEINPIQDTSGGDPSPTNICPISGWDSVGVVRDGKNLADASELLELNSDITYSDADGYYFPKHYDNGGSYPLCGFNKDIGQVTLSYYQKQASAGAIASYIRIDYTDGTNEKPPLSGYSANTWSKITITSNASKVVKNIHYSYNTSNNATYIKDIQLELGSTATTYESYNGTTKTVTLPTTTYGGSVDMVSGNGSDEYSYKVFDGSNDEGWTVANASGHYRAYCSISDIKPFSGAYTEVSDYYICDSYKNGAWADVFDGKSACGMTGTNIGVGIDDLGITDVAGWLAYLSTHNIAIAYKKATADTFSVTPTDIQILKATNNIFADSGNVSVTYKADTQLWVEKKLSEL